MVDYKSVPVGGKPYEPFLRLMDYYDVFDNCEELVNNNTKGSDSNG